MSIRVLIPTALRAYTENKDVVMIDAGTVGELLVKLGRQHRTLRLTICSEDGKLRKFVNLYVNHDDIRYLKREDTALSENDIVSIIPSIAGG